MSDPIIKCDGVYKIFGENAERMLKEANGNVDAKTFQDNGCIASQWRDSDFIVWKSKIAEFWKKFSTIFLRVENEPHRSNLSA